MRHSNKASRFGRVMRTVGPVILMAAVGGMMSGCKNNGNFSFETDGVPLSELDMSGDAPSEVVMGGPDTVIITEGDDFAISLQGSDEAKEHVRFKLDGDMLAIMRDNMNWDGEGATINVTMPAPRKLVIAGSGDMATSTLADQAEVTIAGSGTLSALDIAVDSLDITIAGSGRITAGGTAESLDLDIAGSGTADLGGLKVERADVTIAGSGDATFASDGDVDANIVGSGSVTVRGSARCTVQAVGSGTLTCERGEEEAAE